jgi:hypothetical protein
MTMGPGKYDEEATLIMERTKAKGVIVMIIGGDKGAGFAVQADLITTLSLPSILRSIANQIDADIREDDDKTVK